MDLQEIFAKAPPPCCHMLFLMTGTRFSCLLYHNSYVQDMKVQT